MSTELQARQLIVFLGRLFCPGHKSLARRDRVGHSCSRRQILWTGAMETGEGLTRREPNQWVVLKNTGVSLL